METKCPDCGEPAHWLEQCFGKPVKQTISIEFGAMSEPLSKQFKGLGFKQTELKNFQELADALTRLYVRGLASDSETNRIRLRLLEYIKEKYQSIKTK